MVLLQRIRRQDAGSAVADLFAADYIGALLGGLAFPFLLLPAFGQLRGAIVVGLINAVAGVLLVVVLFRRDLSRRGLAAVGAGATTVITLPRRRVRVLGHIRSHRAPSALLRSHRVRTANSLPGDRDDLGPSCAGRRHSPVPQRRPPVRLTRRVSLSRVTGSSCDGQPSLAGC